jgi:methyl-accepting chemotaxis protein
MSDARTPTIREFRIRFHVSISIASTLAAGGVLLYLKELLALTPAHQRVFVEGIGIAFVLLCACIPPLNTRIVSPLEQALRELQQPNPRREVLRAGLACLLNLPFRCFVFGLSNWAVGALVVVLLMFARLEGFLLFQGAVMLSAATSVGFVFELCRAFVHKRWLEPIRIALVEHFPEADERRAMLRPVALATKLRVGLTGVCLVLVLYSMFLAQVQAGRPLERLFAQRQARVLEAALFSRDREAALAALERRLGELEGPHRAVIVDATSRAIVAGPADALAPHELEALFDVGAARGDSTSFDTPHVFSWALLPDATEIAVIVASWDELAKDLADHRWAFGMTVAVSIVVALALARLIADDVVRTTRQLSQQAQRVEQGDLRASGALDSEDELGELGHAFERMTGGLRATIRRMAETADRVEAAAEEIDQVSDSVAAVTADQVRGLQEASLSVESLAVQVGGIAQSARALHETVDESSSSILELGAAGEELNRTASVLSHKVDEVTASIDQMIRSVREVSRSTEALAGAAVETASSTEETAASMREIDANAAHLSNLSARVVETGESGREKVLQTIQGMEAIREATDTAERVIRSLGGRVVEIGAIVDVIDDVADETNLLALNAAIIAAQAGEQGRAFSVVADEIKDLADRVLVSTKEIGSLVRAFQDESANAIGAVERGSHSVQSGVDLSAQAGVALEDITGTTRESGQRIGEIVAAVREQTKAAEHVASLMERVRLGVEQIRAAGQEQDRGNEAVLRGTLLMRDAAQQVHATTEEQARGAGRLRDNVEQVRESVERIDAALQEQSAVCQRASELLERLFSRTRSNDDSTRRMGDAMRGMREQAAALREDVNRFRV